MPKKKTIEVGVTMPVTRLIRRYTLSRVAVTTSMTPANSQSQDSSSPSFLRRTRSMMSTNSPTDTTTSDDPLPDLHLIRLRFVSWCAAPNPLAKGLAPSALPPGPGSNSLPGGSGAEPTVVILTATWCYLTRRRSATSMQSSIFDT